MRYDRQGAAQRFLEQCGGLLCGEPGMEGEDLKNRFQIQVSALRL